MTHAFTVRPEKELLRLATLRRYILSTTAAFPHSLRKLAPSACHYRRFSLQAVLANTAPNIDVSNFEVCHPRCAFKL